MFISFFLYHYITIFLYSSIFCLIIYRMSCKISFFYLSHNLRYVYYFHRIRVKGSLLALTLEVSLHSAWNPRSLQSMQNGYLYNDFAFTKTDEAFYIKIVVLYLASLYLCNYFINNPFIMQYV